jgi:hypothetical protein
VVVMLSDISIGLIIIKKVVYNYSYTTHPCLIGLS